MRDVVVACPAGVVVVRAPPSPGERRAVVGDAAVAHHHRAVDQRRQRAELVGDQHDRRAALLQHARARRRAPAGWAGRRRRWARRGRAGRARRPAPGRSAPAAAGRRRAGRSPSRARSARPTTSSASRDGRRSAGRERQEQAAAGEPARGDDLPHRGRHAGARAWSAAGTKPIRCQSWKSANGVPKSSTEPGVSGRRPVSARTSVDLPEPLAPISATNSPGRTVRSMPRRIGPAADGDRAVAHLDRCDRTSGLTGIRWPSAARRGSRP